MKALVYILLMLTFFISESKAWDSTAAKFYPLKTGNIFTYEEYNLRIACIQQFSRRYRVSVDGDTLLGNGKRYYVLNGSEWTYQRIDSSTMNVYYFHNGKEILLDSLLGRVGDSFRGLRNPNAYTLANDAFIKSIQPITIFNLIRNSMSIANGLKMGGIYNYKLVEGFGLTEIEYCLDDGMRTFMKGCIIDGIVYGDTLTGINLISASIPDKHILKQNYPNPFNPRTKIIFSLPISQIATLKVYDALGKEVAVLFDQKLSAGSYEVEFDSSNLSGGFYFYRILTDGFSDTKRMMLIK